MLYWADLSTLISASIRQKRGNECGISYVNCSWRLCSTGLRNRRRWVASSLTLRGRDQLQLRPRGGLRLEQFLDARKHRRQYLRLR
jgi:hypothetical protein